jgi:Xaa-Pro dipeptidase
VNGYSAESERTYFTAPPSAKAKSAFAAMMEARRRALVMIRPGVSCCELDSTVSAFLAEEGFAGEEMRLHRMGHGIGLGTHEGPWLAEGSADRLEANMVISIEPGIYLKDIGGFRHSDTVLVTEGGYELLTHYPTEMESLVVTNWKPVKRRIGWLLWRSLRLSNRISDPANSISDSSERVKNDRP